MKKTSLADLAKSLGVSKTLVSMVLNGKGDHHGINKETQKRVISKAKELSYKPNQVARGLRTGKSNTIGLIVADISNSFYSKIARSAEDVASKHGYNVIFCSSDENPEKEVQLMEMLRDRQVDGLIVSSTLKKKTAFQQMQKEGFPFVLIDRRIPNFTSPYVGVDNAKGSELMVDHLISCGHDRIGLLTISPSHLSPIIERQEGYKNALRKNGLRYSKNLVKEIPFGDVTNAVRNSLRELLQPPNSVKAIFVLNNSLASACLTCLNEMDIRIPQDVALVSFDDIELFKFCYPTVTAISQPIDQIGANAVDMLLKMIDSKDPDYNPNEVLLRSELKVRRSCGEFLLHV